MELTSLQKKWLRTRGGRSSADVLYTKLGTPYVLMSAGPGKEEVVMVPNDDEIRAKIEDNMEKYAR